MEAAGYAGPWSAETSHDPFLALAIAAEHTNRLEVGTGIAVAFSRSPLVVSHVAWDLQAYSQGRFNLGLGSQIKAHIERRFSMTWSHPAARMREFILAMRAIWDCWHTGTKLDFRGDFYQHTLMTPEFNPGANQYGAPKVFLAAVGKRMTQVAAETADGVLLHPFTTERYLLETTVPTVERVLAESGKRRGTSFEISLPVLIATGVNETDFERSKRATKRRIAFYGSTPAYRPVLDLHGWGDLQPELNSLSKRGEWAKMGDLIDDGILETFAVVAEPGDLAKKLVGRYADLIDRATFYSPGGLDADLAYALLAEIKTTTQPRTASGHPCQQPVKAATIPKLPDRSGLKSCPELNS
jgi:probable F420-dependent oxidoreductase